MTCRVLIAEEELECCQLFRMFLQRYGYEVTTVHDGISCVEAWQDRAPPDVLILSWELPWGEAEGVLDWRTAQGLDDMAVIVLTARMSTDPGPQELSLPGVTRLQRPFWLDELLHAVQSTERASRNSCNW